MAKDPALLWYFNDWMGGTATLSRHLKGCYMDLLSVQFNNGPLSLEEIKTVLGSDFGSWPALQKKFKFENDCYSNERLSLEREKRSKFTESRRANAKHMPKHMEDINENENENEIINKNNYGEFGNVKLTDEEYQKLTKYCGNENNIKLLIVELDTYIRSFGKDKYVDHYSTLQGWWRRKAQNHIEKKSLQIKTRTIA